jgi:5-methylcytosine-specific restriction endonuclease McrA
VAETCQRTCHIHGQTDFYPQLSRGKYHTWRCKKCNVAGVTRRRRELKLKAVAYKGGCCQHCGYSKSVYALEFHHTDPSQKDFAIGTSGNTYSWVKIVREIDKCILLCANCHREEHERLEKLPPC